MPKVKSSSCRNKDKTIISIFGEHGSGKSTIAKYLRDKIDSDKFRRIAADYFIVSNSEEDLEAYFSKPIEFDWKLLDKIVNLPIGTKITIPTFDFSNFKRISETGGHKVIITEYLIIDSSLPYPNADYYFYLNVPHDLRKARIEERDKRNDQDSTNFYDWYKLSEHEMVKQSENYHYIDLDGTREIKDIADVILDRIGYVR